MRKTSVSDNEFMRAVVFDGRLRFSQHYPIPEVPENWARIRVGLAGICGTDMEILKGYQQFKGILGHEFVGVVDQCDCADWVGRRVVGEINVSCGECEWCKRGLKRHCAHGKALGIRGLDGCMADYCVLPISNLRIVPPSISDETALLIEPLSAACEILDQLQLTGTERALVLGDGPLGMLCAWVLNTILSDITLAGHHPDKMEKAKWRTLKTVHGVHRDLYGADIVVEATGSMTGLSEAMAICRPRGIIVLKSTVSKGEMMNLSAVVVNEQTIVGSRCGAFETGLKLLNAYPDIPLKRLITAFYPIEHAGEAFDGASRSDVLKIALDLN